MKGTACCAGLLLAPALGFSLWLRFFWLLDKKSFYSFFNLLRQLFVFSNNLSNFVLLFFKPKSSEILVVLLFKEIY